jgi:hypothetical protein
MRPKDREQLTADGLKLTAWKNEGGTTEAADG